MLRYNITLRCQDNFILGHIVSIQSYILREVQIELEQKSRIFSVRVASN
jgi:hypothetical protein